MKTTSTFVLAFFNEVGFFFSPLIQISSFCQGLKEKAAYTVWVR